MSKRTAAALLVVALVGLGGWVLAQPGAPGPQKAEAQPGRYAVSGSGDKAVLLDTATGKTWQLRDSADGRTPTWLPLSRIDDPKEAAKWWAEQEDLRRALERRGAGGDRGEQKKP
jgi:hypothetical protein